MKQITRAIDLKKGDYIVSKYLIDGKRLRSVITRIELNPQDNTLTMYFETISGKEESYVFLKDESIQDSYGMFTYTDFYRDQEVEEAFFKEIRNAQTRRKINKMF